MVELLRPQRKPSCSNFSSGPCAKRPGWTASALSGAILGRSHRATSSLLKIQDAIARTRALLEIPPDYRVGIVPGSATGALEMAFWSLLGARPVDVLCWEQFGQRWMRDLTRELRLKPMVFEAEYGYLPDLTQVNTKENDVVFVWNGTSSGVCIPHANWIADDRKGLTICDATSAAFSQTLDWLKLDVTVFSWQKCLGGEAAHGMIALSPRAIERLETYAPSWPVPYLFKLANDCKVIEGIFKGQTINTPSMLAIEDYLDALSWAENIGGLPMLSARVNSNAKVIFSWIARTPWVRNLAHDPQTRSITSVCAVIPGHCKNFAKSLEILLAQEKIAYDINSYPTAPSGLRIWCGATVEREDLEILTEWLDWSYAEIRRS